MGILVLNTGSSSLKFSLFDDHPLMAFVDGQVDWQGQQRGAQLTVRPYGQPERRTACEVAEPASAATLAIRTVRAELQAGDAIRAIGHRVVHGGSEFTESVRIDSRFESALDHLTELAPLHNPPALKAIEAAGAECPGVPQVAVFDTSFFADLPRAAAVYPVPWEWHETFGIRRYGFHGISHAYCSGRAAGILGRDPASLRLVVCHLGNGASAAAVLGGRAIGTTMGFTPLAGLMMGTRSGDVDPGVLVYLMKVKGLTVDQVDDALNHHSGLMGVSGVSGDYRKVEEAAEGGNDRAKLALEIYAAKLRSAIGGLAASMGGLDAIAFTAGVGENSATLRASVCEGLGFLGIRIDRLKNEAHPRDADIAEPDSPVRAVVVHTRENFMIAREVFELIPPA